MSEETLNGGAAPAENAGPQFSVEKIYVKDVSFESPKSPVIFTEQAQPQINLNLSQRVQRLNDNAFEVVLGVTITCTAGDANNTVYVAEVQQAGVFGLSGFEPQMADALLGTQCPAVLYPYARQLLGDLIQAGGFAPFLLQPINFDALYAESLRQRQEQQAAGGTDALANTGTVGNA